MSPREVVEAVNARLPEHGLFHEKAWRVATEPFETPPAIRDDLEKLGFRLRLFLKACDQLYRQSAKGRQPAWIAALLDAGKPEPLVRWQREHGVAGDIPRVLRPDLVLTETGFTIAEIDSIPGGIGLTAWLNETYADLGFDVLGGRSGMLDGFAGIVPGGADIVVSEEAATYRPEMLWLADRLGASQPGRWRVLDDSPREDWQAQVYRFFEHFDLANVSGAASLMEQVAAKSLTVTPPFKPALEEKLWFALFWLQPLESFWMREIGGHAFDALRRVIPYTWLLDPTPLPPHAVLPRLEVNSWDEVARFSQKKRRLILKVSGFSEQAWGSRGVSVASDLPQQEWQHVLQQALDDFDTQPHILQEFHTGRLFNAQFAEPGTSEILTLRGRVRLCPYYFVHEKSTPCGGALATICPDDKKLLHGMRDAILAPARLG